MIYGRVLWIILQTRNQISIATKNSYVFNDRILWLLVLNTLTENKLLLSENKNVHSINKYSLEF